MSSEKYIKLFWECVSKEGPIHPVCGMCWSWHGGLFSEGYGRIGRAGLAHRISWEIHNGPIPKGMYVCHKCDNRECTNPDHLFLGTSKENFEDMISKGRQAKGDSHAMRIHPEIVRKGEQVSTHKLTSDDVIGIRRICVNHSDSVGVSALARKYGIGKSAISKIVRRVSWKHI